MQIYSYKQPIDYIALSCMQSMLDRLLAHIHEALGEVPGSPMMPYHCHEYTFESTTTVMFIIKTLYR